MHHGAHDAVTPRAPLVALASMFILVPAARAAPCAHGARTTLSVEVLARPAIPRPDDSYGTERLVLRARDGQELFSTKTGDGRWVCLGFDEVKGRYVVGGQGVRGAWQVMAGVWYLAEDGSPLAPSAFTRKRFLALTANLGPAAHFVAFVGGRDVADGLYVLDTRKDEVRRLGEAPRPPPLADPDFECDDRFDWGSCWADGTVELEPFVLRFDGEGALVVTYGKDTPRHRAKARRTKRFAL